MLNLGRSRKLSASAIPAHLTSMSVSWLNGQFKAVAVHRGAVEGTWENPAEAEGPANFEALLREAVQKTGFRGQTVSLVLAHPRLVQHSVDVPPVKGAALKKVLQRQAQQQRLFPGEAAWACQQSVSDKAPQSVILHLFPRQLLDQLVQGCKRNGLRLSTVVPAAAVLHSQLAELQLEKEQTALLAGETATSVTVVVGRRDGQIFLARTLPGNWTDGAERLSVDLNRTLLFVNQQFSASVGGVWLFGRRTVDQLSLLQSQVQVPIKISPVQYNPFYWATQSLKLNPELNPNLISLEEQQAPQRRVFAKVVAASTAVVLFLSVTAAAYSSFAARQERANIRLLSRQLTHLQDQRQRLQQRNDELARKQQIIKLVLEQRPPPVPLWFLAYLGQALPSELVVTNLDVKQTNELWTVQVSGTFQSAASLTAESRSQALAALRSSLTGPPFHLRILGDPAKEKDAAPNPSAAAKGVPEWIARVTSNDPAKAEAGKRTIEDHFLIQGILQ